MGEIILLNIIELPVMHDTALAPAVLRRVFYEGHERVGRKELRKMKSKFAKGGPG